MASGARIVSIQYGQESSLHGHVAIGGTPAFGTTNGAGLFYPFIVILLEFVQLMSPAVQLGLGSSIEGFVPWRK